MKHSTLLLSLIIILVSACAPDMTLVREYQQENESTPASAAPKYPPPPNVSVYPPPPGQATRSYPVPDYSLTRQPPPPTFAPVLSLTQTPTFQPRQSPTHEPTLLYSYTSTPGGPVVRYGDTRPTVTPPSPETPQLRLPGDLKIEAYKATLDDSFVIERPILEQYPDRGGQYVWPKGGTISGKQFQADEIRTESGNTVRATFGDDEIFRVDCGKEQIRPALITAWVYNDHWAIQSLCHGKEEIFWDGESLNKTKGYELSIAFQLLDQKPFYLFKRDGKIWLSYNGDEAFLGYDAVKIGYCCMTFPYPRQYEKLIAFYATKGEQLYFVVIGHFKPVAQQ